MSRTKRAPYPRTGKEIGRGEYTEEFRTRQKRGLVRNSIFNKETQEDIWQSKFKKAFKRDNARKERRKIKQELSNRISEVN